MLRQTPWYNHLFLLIMIFVAFFTLTHFPAADNNYTDYTTLSDNFETAALRDSLPELDRYKSKVDSLITLDICNRSKLSNRGDGITSLIGGYTVIRDNDDCSNIQPYNYTGTNKYYLAFSGYKLSSNAEFYTHNGKYFLKKRGWSKNPDGSLRMGWQEKELAVRYVFQPGDGLLLFPVSESRYRFIKTITYIVIGLLALGFIYIVLVLPFRILLTIARSDAFDPRNIRRLHIIGWSLAGFAIVPNLLALLFNVILSSYIPGGIYLPIRNTLLNNSWVLIAGLGVLVVSSAFQKGYEIKLESSNYY